MTFSLGRREGMAPHPGTPVSEHRCVHLNTSLTLGEIIGHEEGGVWRRLCGAVEPKNLDIARFRFSSLSACLDHPSPVRVLMRAAFHVTGNVRRSSASGTTRAACVPTDATCVPRACG
jgi:hypothetical protein